MSARRGYRGLRDRHGSNVSAMSIPEADDENADLEGAEQAFDAYDNYDYDPCSEAIANAYHSETTQWMLYDDLATQFIGLDMVGQRMEPVDKRPASRPASPTNYVTMDQPKEDSALMMSAPPPGPMTSTGVNGHPQGTERVKAKCRKRRSD